MTEVCAYHLKKAHRDVEARSALLRVTSRRQPIAARVLMNVVVTRWFALARHASDRLWALNPTGYNQFAPLGGIVGIFFLALAATLITAWQCGSGRRA